MNWPDYTLPPINLLNIGKASMKKHGLYLNAVFRGYVIGVIVTNPEEEEWEAQTECELLNELLHNFEEEMWEAISRSANQELNDYADHLTDCKRDEEFLNE